MNQKPIKIKLDEPLTHCFKTSLGGIVAVTVYEGELSVFDDSILPTEMKYLGAFEADSVSDFNMEISNILISKKLIHSKAYAEAKEYLKKILKVCLDLY
jgi:hypothetical protein